MNDKNLLDAVTSISKADDTITSLRKANDTLVQQMSDMINTTALYNIQGAAPEVLWYEARSANSPKTGPHGTVDLTLGEPTVADFHPVVLSDHSSDNVYCLFRRYRYLTPEQKQKMETATKFSIGCEVALDNLANVQAFELDYQIRKSNGVVINVGLQLQPTGILRAFDYVNKDWVPLGPKATLTNGIPIKVQLNATCDDKIVQFTSVQFGNTSSQVSLSHPVSMNTMNSPYFNMAYQLDGRADAKAYKAIVGRLTTSFA